MKLLLTGASLIALTAAADAASAQATASAAGSVSEVIVTGTRQTGVRAADSAAPIEVVGSEALRRAGYPDLATQLATAVPSLNVQSNGGDTAALTVTAALRGLSPNDTLVLVNGKRRHSTANLSVDNGSPYSGSATVDLSYIPSGAIDHIEVLQDGAAAQYGSDAIAGVVNIILKSSNHAGQLSATGGQFYEGDGATGAWSINKGITLGDKGFLNATLEERTHSYTEQGGADRRFSDINGNLLSGLNAVDAAGVPKSTNYPKENKLNGDPQYNIYNAMFNAGYDLGDGVQAYAFGSYGQRNASHYENYRKPSKIEGTTSTGVLVTPLPDGFDPSEEFKEIDYSITGGVKGSQMGWNWDLSSTYGANKDSVYTINSANADLFPVLQAASSTPITPQRNFYDGAFTNTEWTNSIDIDRGFAVGLASPLNVALGAEFRRDTYSISAGEPSSYYGGGAQSFDGYTPLDQATHARTNYAVYGDLAADLVKGLHVDAAGRYEHYSDFGDATVGKFTGRYDFNPMIAVRGTISTGFRAPTLAEEYYSGTNVSPNSADVQLPANSAAAVLAGFSALKPEKSTNYSVGFVAHPLERLQITADAYRIDITDRIVGTGFIYGSENGFGATGVVSQGVLNAITAKGVTLDSGLSYAGISIFTNAANTRTQGAEITANYSSDFDGYGHVDWSLGYNHNETTVTKLYALPAVVTSVAFGQTVLLDKAALSALTTATPKDKLILNAFYTYQKWSVNLRETVYGKASEYVTIDGQTYYNEVIPVTGITDLEVGYKLTDAIRLSVGANNLFNIIPPLTPNVVYKGSLRPENGANVYNVPMGFAAWGSNGGYYYGRVTYSF